MLQSNTLRRSTLAVLAATLSVAMVACNGTKTPVTNAVTAVTVSPTTAALNLTTTKTVQATATVTVTGTAAKTVAWTTDNSAVATVSSTGLITAVGAGNTNVKACSTVAGATTKCGTVAVTVTAGTTTGTSAKISFRPATANTLPAGFTANTGAGFTAAAGGWVTEASAGTATKVALDLTGNTRYRNPSDATNVVQGLAAEQYTQIQPDCGDVTTGNTCAGSTSTTAAGAFEYPVTNGKYTVVVSVGDADKRNTNSSHVVNVEGTAAISATVLAAGAFKTGTATVTVSDGYLTIDTKTGKNTKINYVTITPAP